MARRLNPAWRLGALVALGSVLAIGAPVHAQVDASISATLTVTPPSTSPDTVVQLVANFQSSGDFTNVWGIWVEIAGTGGAGTLASVVGGSNTSGCNIDVTLTNASCIWTPGGLNETTSITVDIVVAANAIPASPGWVITARESTQTLATTNLEIVDPPVETDPPTGSTTTVPPVQTDPPTGSTTTPTATTDPPTGSTTTPTATTDPPAVSTPPSTSPSGGVGSQSPDGTSLPVTGTMTWPTLLAALAALVGGVVLIRLSGRNGPAK